MAVVCVRRHSDSQFSRAIYDAIKGICYQKQCPNEERISKFILREFDWTPKEITEQLRLAVKDGLFREVIAVSHKGSSKGTEQTSYRPDNVDINSNSETKPVQTHDWYCFDCQESGEVVLCNYCPKVFHKKCAKAASISPNEQWKCPSCKIAEGTTLMSRVSKEEINNMLTFTIGRMKEKFKDLGKPVSIEDCPDCHLYIFHPISLSCIEKNIENKKYNSPEHFLEDVKLLLHNSIIYFGDDDELTNQAEELVDDAKQEIEEMLLCPDCYNLSNSKPKNWFCKPCNPPHEIVWAKMTGQQPWPAKVLKWNEDKSRGLVRFFEARHQRAWVYSRNITPITVKPDVKKRPRTWLEAQQELHLYLRQLGDIKMNVKTKADPEPSFVDEPEEDEPEAPCSPMRPSNATASCQTGEDSSTAVIDKLRKRIDDLEQDLQETKAKLNLQQARHEEQENGKLLTLNTKIKLEKLLAALSERWQRNFEISELTEEQIRKNFEKEQSEYNGKLEALRKNMEDEKRKAIEGLRFSLQVKHDSEIGKLREQTKLQQLSFVETVKTKIIEEKRREIDESTTVLQRRHESELKIQREALEREYEGSMTELKRQQKLVLRETVRDTKRKQWCCNCEQEASYPCCWNTSYCSRQCQVVHWQQHRHQCSRNLVYLGLPSRS